MFLEPLKVRIVVPLLFVSVLGHHQIFEHSPAKKIVGEPDASVKPYEVVAQELNYMPQYQIVMPEKTAMLYFCDKEGFYCKFAHYLNASIKE